MLRLKIDDLLELKQRSAYISAIDFSGPTSADPHGFTETRPREP